MYKVISNKSIKMLNFSLIIQVFEHEKLQV